MDQRFGDGQSQSFCTAWRTQTLHLKVKPFHFMDDSFSKLQIGWRCMEYGAIGQPVRWHDDIRRDGTWTILSTYTSDGYVPCTGIKEQIGTFWTQKVMSAYIRRRSANLTSDALQPLHYLFNKIFQRPIYPSLVSSSHTPILISPCLTFFLNRTKRTL